MLHGGSCRQNRTRLFSTSPARSRAGQLSSPRSQGPGLGPGAAPAAPTVRTLGVSTPGPQHQPCSERPGATPSPAAAAALRGAKARPRQAPAAASATGAPLLAAQSHAGTKGQGPAASCFPTRIGQGPRLQRFQAGGGGAFTQPPGEPHSPFHSCAATLQRLPLPPGVSLGAPPAQLPCSSPRARTGGRSRASCQVSSDGACAQGRPEAATRPGRRLQ